ncbi:MerC domain-containing protein [Sandaracinobacteroides hominis]|uniref:MerC domain-containing protein n=1 Tax=Sandaracinobacteroides hominis TaxID=2780086 RepID=UPI0018F29A9E|nr:MerC domain-containing protein [Sandaracinobacteroides hominis]
MSSKDFKQDVEGEPLLDGAAAALSSLCLLHCLLLPLGLVLAPAVNGVADGLMHGPVWVHWLLLAAAAPVSVYALRRGYFAHGDAMPWKIALGGFLLMALGALAHDYSLLEPALTVGGGLVVAFAHWRNWSARKA